MADTKTKNKKEVKRKIPLRNYLITLVILVAVVLLTLYGFQLYNLQKEEKLAQSYLISNKVISHEVNNINELELVMTEAPTDYFLFISYTGNQDTYNLEKKLEDVIKDYNLSDYIYYVNVVDMMDKDNYLSEISKAVGLEIKSVPIILYYSNGEVVKEGIIAREDGSMLTAGDFAKFLDKYEINGGQ